MRRNINLTPVFSVLTWPRGPSVLTSGSYHLGAIATQEPEVPGVLQAVQVNAGFRLLFPGLPGRPGQSDLYVRLQPFRPTRWGQSNRATQEKMGVSVVKGAFAPVLNEGNQFSDSSFNGQARWLEITVDCGRGATTHSPRQELLAVPYALSLRFRWDYEPNHHPLIIAPILGGRMAPVLPLWLWIPQSLAVMGYGPRNPGSTDAYGQVNVQFHWDSADSRALNGYLRLTPNGEIRPGPSQHPFGFSGDGRIGLWTCSQSKPGADRAFYDALITELTLPALDRTGGANEILPRDTAGSENSGRNHPNINLQPSQTKIIL